MKARVKGGVRRLPSLIALTLWAAACGAADARSEIDPASVPEAERYGGTVVVPISTQPPTLSTLAAVDWPSAYIN